MSNFRTNSSRIDGASGKPASRRWAAAFFLLFLCVFLDVANAQLAAPQTPNPAPARLTDAQVSQRVDALLRQMTLDEKIGQLNQLFMFAAPSPQQQDGLRKAQTGSFLYVSDPARINALQRSAIEQSRLKIPLLFGFDVIHGFRTIFPVPIAMAASWDPAMVEKVQAMAAREARAVGIHWTFAPMVDIARDARWGRMVEGAGEDPYLGSAMAAAHVRGFQGAFLGAPDHLIATAKHYAGYGAAEGGRDYDASYIPETQMWNVYLPPFHAAVQAGAGTLMSAYMDLNDVPATGNHWLLTEVLRDTWKFGGFVVSDADSVKSLVNHGFARDLADAAVRALNAGVDMEMAFEPAAYGATLAQSLKQGLVTEQQIDNAARRILDAKVRMGLFENPYVDEARAKQVLATPAHREQARIAAERTAVLLKNDKGVLPLNKSRYKSIAVIGPLADRRQDILGSWTFEQDMNEIVTVLAGITNKLGASAKVEYAPGVRIARDVPSIFDQMLKEKHMPPWTDAQAKQEFDRAVNLARASDVTVLVLGEAQDMSGEYASRSSLELPGRQNQLMQAVVATGKPVVIVLISGRPLDIRWAAQNVPAILQAWYPGTQGGSAIANLLFGDAVPGGKLPVSWPKHVGQVPIYYSHNLTQNAKEQNKRYWDDEFVPLYPFGFGLSYTSFAYSNLKLSRTEVKPAESFDVTVDVANTGSIAGDEVVQLYIHQRAGSASRPVRELKGFERVRLAPGEKRTVRFALGKNELSFWSPQAKKWVVEPENFDVWAGGDSNASLHAEFRIVP